MNIAIIPARGGSKRIPGKNIKPFLGIPAIAYPIKAARDSGVIDMVVVSTDSQEIAEVARKFGASVLERPPELADDHIGTQPVMAHAMRVLQDGTAGTYKIENACCIYPTAVLLRGIDLRSAYGAWQNYVANPERNTSAIPRVYCFSVVRYGAPIEQALRIDQHKGVHAHSTKHGNARSQDLVDPYHDAGQFYWGTRRAFEYSAPLIGPCSMGYEMPRWRAIDINTPEDWATAEIMALGLRDDNHARSQT